MVISIKIAGYVLMGGNKTNFVPARRFAKYFIEESLNTNKNKKGGNI